MMIDEKIIIVASLLVILVNIITEVAKNVIPSLKTSKTINLFVLILSVVLTVIAYFFYTHYYGVAVDVYGVITSVIAGILVSYSAMFGFDKLLVYFKPFMKGEN